MRAVLNGSYMNVDVGLGRWPVKVRGLLANAASGRSNQIETRDGRVLTSPFGFEALYGRFADGWRVPADESMVSVCGTGSVVRGIPGKLFFARHLDTATYTSARAVCTAAGVKGNALLDACTLDVAVIGKKSAAEVFVGSPAPTAVGHQKGEALVDPRRHFDRSPGRKAIEWMTCIDHAATRSFREFE